MFRFTTHCLLLLTIVTSQVLSGVSCCCLARCLTMAQRQVGALDAMPAPKCPKCAASHVSASLAKASSCHGQTQNGEVDSRGQGCSCNKAPLIASQSDQQQVPNVGLLYWMGPFPSASFSSVEFIRANRFILPARFGGEAWQSIACVWRN